MSLAFPRPTFNQALSAKGGDYATDLTDDEAYSGRDPTITSSMVLDADSTSEAQTAPGLVPAPAELAFGELFKPPYPTQGVTINGGCDSDFWTCSICSSNPNIDCVPAKAVHDKKGIYRLCTLPGPYAEYCMPFKLPIYQEPAQTPSSKLNADGL